MHFRHVPDIGARYWVAISIASMAGANLGDFVSHVLHFGHVAGLPVLAALFGAVLVLERRDRSDSEAFYWLAILLLRTAATNLADLATHDLHLGYGWVIAGLAILLAATVAPNLDQRGAAQQSGMQTADGLYWISMLIAGTLGTAIGDAVADVLGLGLPLATLTLGLILAGLLGLRANPRCATRRGYWLTILGVRSAGTTAGDLSAHTLGLAPSTIVTGLALAGLLVLWVGKTASSPGPA